MKKGIAIAVLALTVGASSSFATDVIIPQRRMPQTVTVTQSDTPTWAERLFQLWNRFFL